MVVTGASHPRTIDAGTFSERSHRPRWGDRRHRLQDRSGEGAAVGESHQDPRPQRLAEECGHVGNIGIPTVHIPTVRVLAGHILAGPPRPGVRVSPVMVPSYVGDSSAWLEVFPGEDECMRRSQQTRQGWVLAIMCAGMFLVLLDVTVINVALPAIGSGLSADVPQMQWIVTGYTVTFAARAVQGIGAALLLPATLAVRRSGSTFPWWPSRSS